MGPLYCPLWNRWLTPIVRPSGARYAAFTLSMCGTTPLLRDVKLVPCKGSRRLLICPKLSERNHPVFIDAADERGIRCNLEWELPADSQDRLVGSGLPEAGRSETAVRPRGGRGPLENRRHCEGRFERTIAVHVVLVPHLLSQR